MNPKRNVPNVLVTGTPGVGKSTLCKKLAEVTGLKWLEISTIAKKNNCLSEYDAVYECAVLDEDKLMDSLEEIMCNGGNIVDYHGCDFFPKRWFDVVYILRTNNTVLYDRLTTRGYAGKKLEDNIDCEIFQVILDEAKESYDHEIVHELKSDTNENMETNIQTICAWLEQWLSKDT